MEIYILKSAACLVVFLAFYKLVFENTSFHHFKRFYLLGSLFASFLIPIITFTTYVEITPSISVLKLGNTQIILSETAAAINYWPYVLWMVYGIGVLFFSVRFIRNLFGLIQKIRQNPKFVNRSFIHILLTETVIPHTFFSYIFLNKAQFEHHEIPLEVLLHEETHARQKHSLDIVLIEIVQIVFWFNPLLYFLKRSIKLNHEFLADRAVLNAGSATSDYQKILLAFSTPNGFRESVTPSLAHSINYSSTKKRFTAMKTQTSSRAIFFKSLLFLPLLSILIYGFSTKEVERISPVDQVSNQTPFLNIQVVGNRIILNDAETTLSDFVAAVDAVTKNWSKQDYEQYNLIIREDNISDEFRNQINTEFRKTNLAKQSDSKNMQLLRPFEGFPQPPTPPSVYDNVPGPNQPVEHVKAMDARDAKFLYKNKSISAEKAIDMLMNNENLAVRTTLKDPAPPVVSIYEKTDDKLIFQEATKYEVIEYNKLAKKYNSNNNKTQIFKRKDLERLYYLYGQMSMDQKKSSEPHPNIPPPPPPTPQSIKVRKGGTVPQPPAPPMYKSSKAPSAENGNLYRVAEAPPTPNADPVQYLKELEKRGAVFYIGPHKYSLDEAIKMIQKSDNEITIDVSKYPDVQIGGC